MADGPVKVRLSVEAFSDAAVEEVEVDRDEWDALSVAERNTLLDDMAEAHATQYMSYGWDVEDADDMAETLH